MQIKDIVIKHWTRHFMHYKITFCLSEEMASSSYDMHKKDRGIWLVGGTNETITGCKLPSNQQVLQHFFHLHNDQSQTISASAEATMEKVIQFWEKARIPVRKNCHIVAKIKDLHSAWISLKKNASRRSNTQMEKERQFTESLPNLFDIAHAEALTMITLPEDRAFLLAQREKGRRGSMGPVDMVLAQKEERHRKRQLQKEAQRVKEADRVQKSATDVQNSSSESEAETTSDTGDDSSPPQTPSEPKRRRPTAVVSKGLAAALDRTKVSDRNATYIIAAAAESLGLNPASLAINKESIRRARHKHRELAAKEIQASFDPNCPLTVHWDGKMLPALMSTGTGTELVDRLAVLVSGEGTMKLLGVPKLSNGTGQAEATAVYDLIQEWNLADRIMSMSFDTTASNTGIRLGACVLLEEKLGKDLLSLACRHHIMELIIAKVFNTLLGPSCGPNIKLFQRFGQSWSSIDQSKYESGLKEDPIASVLNPVRDDLIKFIQQQLTEFQPRDDYRELLQLSLLFLGAELKNVSVHIQVPGAFHHARWMAKLIYSMKIFLFRSQFRLTAREMSGLSHFNSFVLKVYLKAWFTCACASSAPRNDLQLLCELENYKKINESVANAAIKSFSGHLWYLSETLVGLAFFDSEVSNEMKSAMVAALDIETTDHPRRCAFTTTLLKKKLSDFVSQHTRQLFTALDIPLNFLTSNPATWSSDNDYIIAQKRVRCLKVVNDAAERGVALIQTFNGILTNQEEQKQFLLQVVEKHRRDFPNPNKSTFVAAASVAAASATADTNRPN